MMSINNTILQPTVLHKMTRKIYLQKVQYQTKYKVGFVFVFIAYKYLVIIIFV